MAFENTEIASRGRFTAQQTSKTLLSPACYARACPSLASPAHDNACVERTNPNGALSRENEASKNRRSKMVIFARSIFIDRRSLQCRIFRFQNPFGFGMRTSCAATPEYVAVRISALNSFAVKSYAKRRFRNVHKNK